MDMDGGKELPLAQTEDLEELTRRYRIISTPVLRRWMSFLIGPHRNAMAAILKERGLDK